MKRLRALRPSNLVVAGLLVLAAIATWTLIESQGHGGAGWGGEATSADLVRRLELTDLALFTEARYTRHLTQSDLHTAFQDHPMALEHFPSGSLFGPPDILTRSYAPVD